MYPPALGEEQRVTASELVRHFGLWQERAARAPIYILHRGRPRLVLTSLDVMEALCAPHSGGGETERSRLAALLATTRDIVLWCDRDGGTVAASQSARAILGAVEFASVERIAATGAAFLGAALARVLRSGIAESIEIAPAPYPERRWSCLIEPGPGGALLIARDVTDETALSMLRAEAAAIEQAMSATDAVASARIGLRGYFESASAALAVLTGIAPDAFASARFVSLFEIGSRVAVADAIEATIAEGSPRSVAARLLVNRGDPVAVTVAMAAVRRGAPIEAVQALVVRGGTDNAA